MQALGDEDKDNIHQTIDDEVLKRQDIVFRSTRVESAADGLSVEGELTLAGATQPIAFDLAVGDDGALAAHRHRHADRWGMKPYSALWGALKVLDDVEVALDGQARGGLVVRRSLRFVTNCALRCDERVAAPLFVGREAPT